MHLARGPFDVRVETSLLRDRRIDALVTKNSGGSAAAAKLHAARELELPVVMIDRPPTPAWKARVATVVEAIEWVDKHGSAA